MRNIQKLFAITFQKIIIKNIKIIKILTIK